MPPLPFATQARTGCPTHAELALSLAAEFRPVDSAAVDGALDALAAQLAVARALPEEEQLPAVGAVLAALAPSTGVVDRRGLMLDEVLERLSGRPVLLAVVGVEIGRRAGLDLGVVGDGHRHLIAHRGLERAAALDPALRASRTGEPEQHDGLTWRCSHQVCFAILREMIERSLRCGDVAAAIRAAEMRQALPLEPAALERARHELATLHALLN